MGQIKISTRVYSAQAENTFIYFQFFTIGVWFIHSKYSLLRIELLTKFRFVNLEILGIKLICIRKPNQWIRKKIRGI